MDFLHSDAFLVFILILNLILLVWAIIGNIRIKNIHDKDKVFMEKLGKGTNIKDDLNEYMKEVKTTEDEIKRVSTYCKKLDKKTEACLQKVGVVRYNAYKDTGSDLSFAICLLDQNNNGIVLNGIYSRETSNIYAKPIQNGKSTYKITPEEQKAIDEAVNKI